VETSLQTILAPADIIIQLLFLPKLIYFCAIFAYEGFKNGVTLTHVGMRKGAIAKIYGVFYSAFIIFSILTIPVYVKDLLVTDVEKIKQALIFAASIPEIGLIFIGISLFLFLLKEGLTRFSKKKIPRNEYAQKMVNSILLLPLAIGVQALLGLPHWVYVGIMAYFMYFGAFASPQIIKKAMPVPVEKQSHKDKNTLKEKGAL
jgi:hypothetical protein